MVPSGARLLEVDPVTTHRYALFGEQLALNLPLREGAVRPHDPMPWKVALVGRGQDAPHESRCVGVDVAIGLDTTGWNLADSLEDGGDAGLVTRSSLPCNRTPARRIS